MAETIESFVNKLQKEGVEAGQEAAEKIRSEAEDKARAIIEDAKKQAEKIVADAEKEAETRLEKGRSELQLAVRDAEAQLKSIVTDTLDKLLVQPVQEKLEDADFLGSLIHDVIVQYARQDSENQLSISISLKQEQRDKLAGMLQTELQNSLKDAESRVNIQGTLRQAGFEYSIGESTNEVTVESVVDVLSRMISPDLRNMMEQDSNG